MDRDGSVFAGDWVSESLGFDVDGDTFILDSVFESITLVLDTATVVFESATLVEDSATVVFESILESAAFVFDWVSLVLDCAVCVVVTSSLLDCVRRDLELVI